MARSGEGRLTNYYILVGFRQRDKLAHWQICLFLRIGSWQGFYGFPEIFYIKNPFDHMTCYGKSFDGLNILQGVQSLSGGFYYTGVAGGPLY